MSGVKNEMSAAKKIAADSAVTNVNAYLRDKNNNVLLRTLSVGEDIERPLTVENTHAVASL